MLSCWGCMSSCKQDQIATDDGGSARVVAVSLPALAIGDVFALINTGSCGLRNQVSRLSRACGHRGDEPRSPTVPSPL
jgi:hypothetical protein